MLYFNDKFLIKCSCFEFVLNYEYNCFQSKLSEFLFCYANETRKNIIWLKLFEFMYRTSLSLILYAEKLCIDR